MPICSFASAFRRRDIGSPLQQFRWNTQRNRRQLQIKWQASEGRRGLADQRRSRAHRPSLLESRIGDLQVLVRNSQFLLQRIEPLVAKNLPPRATGIASLGCAGRQVPAVL
jgi:hypothetical protein